MADNSSAYSGGVGIAGVLGIVFIVLKLCEVIDWSWWLVLLPLYAGPALFLGVFGLVLVAVGLLALKDAIVKKFRR